MADNVAHADMLFYPLYYDIIILASKEITEALHLLLGFGENQIIFWDFKIQNSFRIIKGLDTGDLDNRRSTVQQVDTTVALQIPRNKQMI